MAWNWEQDKWPIFSFDNNKLLRFEADFLHRAGLASGILLHLSGDDRDNLRVELIANEALKTSEIEGEILNRDSVQSSVRRNFGLQSDRRKVSPAEQGISAMMVDLYRNFAEPLSHEILYAWHNMLMNGRTDVEEVGMYRTKGDPMQVVSGAIYNPNIHFEAPPAKAVKREMASFIQWFNNTAPQGKNPLPALTRAGLAHLYFVSIHPFEDGNGRIARALSEKALSQALGAPTLIALAHTINTKKKAYYSALERNNKGLEVTDWLGYFAETILEAQEYSLIRLRFIIQKTRLLDRLRGQLNPRQKKVLIRMFEEGPEGFKGGLSSGNYQRITGASAATTTRDLQELVSLGALNREGEHKATRYYLNLAD